MSNPALGEEIMFSEEQVLYLYWKHRKRFADIYFWDCYRDLHRVFGGIIIPFAALKSIAIVRQL